MGNLLTRSFRRSEGPDLLRPDSRTERRGTVLVVPCRGQGREAIMSRHTRRSKGILMLVGLPLLVTLVADGASATTYSRTKRYEISAPGVVDSKKDPVCSVGSCATTDKT